MQEGLEQASQALESRQAACAKVDLAILDTREKQAALQQALHALEEAFKQTASQARRRMQADYRFLGWPHIFVSAQNMLMSRVQIK